MYWVCNDADGFYLRNIPNPPYEYVCNCGFFWPKEGEMESTEWEFYVILLAGLGAAPLGMSRDVLLTSEPRSPMQCMRGRGGIRRTSTLYRWNWSSLTIHVSLFFCFLNVIISKTKSEYNPHEPKCVFFLIWEQPGSFPLAGCSFPPQVLRSKAGMQSFTFSLQVLLIKEALYKKHFSSVLINQINKNKNFCQAICFCSYPSTGLK